MNATQPATAQEPERLASALDLLLAERTQTPGCDELDLHTLTSFQRSLLTTDGTVTKFIESYTLEPIEIVLLGQESRRLPAAHTWLDAPAETPVVSRQVLLRGQRSEAIYVYAISLLLPERLPAAVARGLAAGDEGIGRLLLQHQQETRREVLWYGREQIHDLPEEVRTLTGEAFLSRTYRIIANRRPTMLISEKFPTAEKIWAAYC